MVLTAKRLPLQSRSTAQEKRQRLRERKIARLRSARCPRLVDLFAGCGGLSLGFHREGFEVSASIEHDELAARTHGSNFFRDRPSGERDLHSRSRDIVETEPEPLTRELGLGDMETAVDVIIGGPPCQAFARVGRAKLREVAEHPEAFLRDPRSDLYLRYLRYVEAFQPLAILMENVPDVLNYGGHNIANEMCEVLEAMGYRCKYTLLNAAYYGVPQMRERMFLIGYAEELDITPSFPAPTHWVDLPRGYEGTRAVALKTISERSVMNQIALFSEERFYVPPPTPRPQLLPAVTASEALGDLPPITLHLEGKLRRGARRFDSLVRYRRSRPSGFARMMREWPGFESAVGVQDHVIRYLPRDFNLFRHLPHGAQYPEAHKIATRLFEKRLKRLASEGATFKPGSKRYEQLKASIVPPYDPGKFPNKWRKMEPDRPARTLMAHLGKDSYSHIHYDNEQSRTISVREAARLQSFPDGFVFSGTMNPALRQIGNAVPPLMAAALAREIVGKLRR